jgi:hypothetical protein
MRFMPHFAIAILGKPEGCNITPPTRISIAAGLSIRRPQTRTGKLVECTLIE